MLWFDNFSWLEITCSLLMNAISKSFIIKRLLKLTVNPFISKHYSVTFLPLHLNKTKFSSARIKLFSNSFISILNRDYMDLASVIRIFELEVPSHLSEKWDNTGLLIEPSNSKPISAILFTNDLTEDVLEEAVSTKSDLIISYHPPIFSPIKTLKKSNWKERIVIKCLENSISVYSPHTSCDAVAGGVNDWLINCFDIAEVNPIHPSYEPLIKYSHLIDCSLSLNQDVCQLLSSASDTELCGISTNSGKQNVRIKVTKSSLNNVMKLLTGIEDTPSISITALDPIPIPSCGMGRIGKLVQPLTLNECVKCIKSYLKLDFIRFSRGVSHSLDSSVFTVAVCAGSGSSVLKGVVADLYITGEMSHHDLLDANHRNVSVILCEHSNSERGYLPHLVEKLRPNLPGIKLIISSSDKDPVSIM